MNYAELCRWRAELRAATRPDSTVYVRHTIDRRTAKYEATLLRRLPSGRYLLRIDLLGKSYRVITDASNVAITKGKSE